MGGAGDGSTRTCGFDSARVIRSSTKVATSRGVRFIQVTDCGDQGQAGSCAAAQGRGSQPIMAVGIMGTGLFNAASLQIQLPASERREKGCIPAVAPCDCTSA